MPATIASPSSCPQSPRKVMRFKDPNPPQLKSARRLFEKFSTSPMDAISQKVLQSPRKQLRQISKVPFKVLDAPELTDDFYLNLVDWSSSNILSVGLATCVYLWSACTSRVTKLCDLGPYDSVTSIDWVQRVGQFLSQGWWREQVRACVGGVYIRGRTWLSAPTVASFKFGTRQSAKRFARWLDTRRVSVCWGGSIEFLHNRNVGVERPCFNVGKSRPTHLPPWRSMSRTFYEALEWTQAGSVWSKMEPWWATIGIWWKWQSLVVVGQARGNSNLQIDQSYGCRQSNFVVTTSGMLDTSAHFLTFQVPLCILSDWLKVGLLASGGGTADRKIRFWNTGTGTQLQCVDSGSQVSRQHLINLYLGV